MAGQRSGVVPADPTTAPGHTVRLVLTLVCSLACVLAVVLVATPQAQAAGSRSGTQATSGGEVGSRTTLRSRRAAVRLRAVRLAAAQRGDPYRYGAAGPNAFDCSGLMTWVFNRQMGRNLPRTSAAQYAASRHVAKRNVRRGDMVFFTSGGRVSHVGIYAGRHRIWHAPYSGTRVRLERIWTAGWRVGRILR